jgi:gliding motility-associated-like protein
MKLLYYFKLLLITASSWFVRTAAAQNVCPDNIDFEAGTFNHWTCFTGNATNLNGQNIINLNLAAPTNNRHTIKSLAQLGEMDYYGNFPVLCPNGSGYSIKLGNDHVDAEAEAVSYVFTIPANANFYSIVYNYALVLEDTRNSHPIEARPRMETRVTDLTNFEVISCSSLTFIGDSSISGFYPSEIKEGIVCKSWSAITINLNGYAGKTIELKFISADCTFGAHFGYAYLDVNTGCGNPVYGTVHCADVDTLHLSAPVGFETYAWYNHDFTQLLGSGQYLSLTPTPTDGTGINLVVTPVSNYGCPDTLYNTIRTDTIGVTANAGPDKISCNQQPVQLGGAPQPGYYYSWSPPVGLSNTGVSNPIATPAVNTTYILTASKDGAGCSGKDTVVVLGSVINADFSLKNTCVGLPVPVINNSAAQGNQPISYSWDFSNGQLSQERIPVIKYQQPGTYAVKLTVTTPQCISSPVSKTVNLVVDKPRTGITYTPVRTPVNFFTPLQARAGANFLWKPALYLSNATLERPVFKGMADQQYTVEITTESGCKTVDTQQVKIYKKIDVFVPTAFTPDKNGVNDVLRPVLLGISELKYFRVYNRWGQLVFDTKTEQQGWDGTYQGKLQPMQGYTWVLEAVDVDGVLVSRKGSAMLLR